MQEEQAFDADSLNESYTPVNTFYQRSKENHAAVTSLLTNKDGDVSQDFKTMQEEFVNTGESSTMKARTAEWQAEKWEKDKELVKEVLVSDDVTLEEKAKFLDGYNAMWQPAEGVGQTTVDSSLDILNENIKEDQITNPHPYERLQLPNKTVDQSAMAVLPVLASIRRKNAMAAVENEINKHVVSQGSHDFLDSWGEVLQMMIPLVEAKFWFDTNEELGFDSSLFTGQNKAKAKEYFQNLPSHKLVDFTKDLISVVDAQSDDVIFSDQNKYMQIDALRTVVEDNYYGDFDQAFDNIISVLDVVGLTSPLAKPLKGVSKAAAANMNKIPKGLEKSYQALSAGVSNYVSSGIRSMSAGKSAITSNWDKGTKLKEAAKVDEEASQAIFTSSKDDVAFSEIGAAKTEGGFVAPNAKAPRSITNLPEDMQEVLRGSTKGGRLDLMDSEVRQIVDKVAGSLNTTRLTKVTNNNGMRTLQIKDGAIDIQEVYTLTDGGWLNADSAIEETKFALRDLGVVDSDLSLKIKDNVSGLWRDTDKAEIATLEARGEIFEKGVGLNKKYELTALDVNSMESFDVGTWFSRSFTSLAGESATRHVFPMSTLIDKKTYGSFSLGVDKAADTAQKVFNTMATAGKAFNKFSEGDQNLINGYIKKANREGEWGGFDELLNAGLQQKHLDFLNTWKDYTDMTYHFNSQHFNKVLAKEGWSLFMAKDTKLVAREVTPDKMGKSARVYDPTSEEYITLSKEQIDEFAADGYKFAQPRSPEALEGNSLLLVWEDSGSYLRKITKEDNLLNYREGYVPVKYDAPYIIRRVDNQGRVTAVSTANNLKDAMADKNLRNIDAPEGVRYIETHNRKDKGTKEIDTDTSNLISSGYGTTQKVRGKRLEDASTDVIDDNILPPMDAFVSSVNEVTRRFSMINSLTSAEKRYVTTWGKYTGGRVTDEVLPQFKGAVGKEAVDIANMKTAHSFLQVANQGYQNTYQQAYASMMRGIASTLGRTGKAQWVEKKLLQGANMRDPMTYATHVASTAYISLSPFRQFFLQSLTTLQLAPINPSYVAKGQLARDLGAYSYYATVEKYGKGANKLTKKEWAGLSKTSGKSEEDLREMFKAVDDSGLLSSLNNLVNDSVSALVREPAYKQDTLDRAIEVGRTGFKAGEQLAIVSSFFTFYSKAARIKGGRLTQEEIAEQVVRTRSFTGDMNRAGDMPYNKNLLKPLLQFQQVPHKMAMNMTTSKQFDTSEKLALAGFNLVMFGLPTAWMIDIIGEDMPEDKMAREAVTQGLLLATVNSTLSSVSGQDVGLSAQGIAPLAAYDFADLLHEVSIQDPMKTLAATPAGGYTNKIVETIGAASRIFNHPKDKSYWEKVKLLAPELAGLTSGTSYAYKTAVLMEAKKAFAKTGEITDREVSNIEALAAIIGVKTIDEEFYWRNRTIGRKGTKEFYDDLKSDLKNMRRLISAEYPTKAGFENALDVSALLMAKWQDNPEALEFIQKEERKAILDGDPYIGKALQKNLWMFTSKDEYVNYLITSGVNQELIDTMLEIYDYKEGE